MPPESDQADILAENTRLTGELSAATTNLTSAQSEVTTLRTENTNLKTQLTEAQGGSTTLQGIVSARTKERDDLKAENDGLKTQMADFNKRVAAELAKRGIRGAAVDQPKNEGDRKLTATEKAMAARAGK